MFVKEKHFIYIYGKMYYSLLSNSEVTSVWWRGSGGAPYLF